MYAPMVAPMQQQMAPMQQPPAPAVASPAPAPKKPATRRAPRSSSKKPAARAKKDDSEDGEDVIPVAPPPLLQQQISQLVQENVDADLQGKPPPHQAPPEDVHGIEDDDVVAEDIPKDDSMEKHPWKQVLCALGIVMVGGVAFLLQRSDSAPYDWKGPFAHKEDASRVARGTEGNDYATAS